MKRRAFIKTMAALSAVGLQVNPQAASLFSFPADSDTSMPRRPLGRTGVQVSALALGGVIGMQLARMKGIEESLKRLRSDHVDLLQIHAVGTGDNPAAWDRPEGVVTALRKLREHKVIRFFGVTGHDSAEALRRAIEMFEFDTLLTTLNPVSRRQPFREGLLVAANRKLIWLPTWP